MALSARRVPRRAAIAEKPLKNSYSRLSPCTVTVGMAGLPRTETCCCLQRHQLFNVTACWNQAAQMDRLPLSRYMTPLSMTLLPYFKARLYYFKLICSKIQGMVCPSGFHVWLSMLAIPCCSSSSKWQTSHWPRWGRTAPHHHLL